MYNRSSFPFTLDCVGSNTLLTESKGQLASPAQGGSGVCAWQISVPKDLRIIFYFQSYNIDSSINSYRSVPECSDQDTRIELKDSPTDPPWRTYCERNMPEPIATDKSVLFVQFKLPKSDSKSWFTAEYITFPFEHGEYGYRPYVMWIVFIFVKYRWWKCIVSEHFAKTKTEKVHFRKKVFFQLQL